MQKKYIFLTFLLMAMIFVVAFVAERNNCDSSISEQFHFKSKKCTAMSPEKLLITALSSDRFIGVDDLAQKIISEDPTYILIDIREKEEFQKYSLPGAINVPFKNILKVNDSEPFYKSSAYIKVIFSNNTMLADQAWIIMRRMGCKNIKVLDGGLNRFFLTLMNPAKPKETDSQQAFDMYRFRKSAGIYFGMPNPQEFIPKQQLAIYKAKRKIEIAPRVHSAKSNGNKAKSQVKKQVKIIKKKQGEDEEDEEDEGC